MKVSKALLVVALGGVTISLTMACITPSGINDARGIVFGNLNLLWQAVPPVPGIFQVCFVPVSCMYLTSGPCQRWDGIPSLVYSKLTSSFDFRRVRCWPRTRRLAPSPLWSSDWRPVGGVRDHSNLLGHGCFSPHGVRQLWAPNREQRLASMPWICLVWRAPCRHSGVRHVLVLCRLHSVRIGNFWSPLQGSVESWFGHLWKSCVWLYQTLVDETIYMTDRDRWNWKGDLSCTRNKIPYKDWRSVPYSPKEDCDTCWKPLKEHDGLGFLYNQVSISNPDNPRIKGVDSTTHPLISFCAFKW